MSALLFGLTDVTSDVAAEIPGFIGSSSTLLSVTAVAASSDATFGLDGMDLRQPFNRQPC